MAKVVPEVLPEPETRFRAAEIISRAPTALGVTPEAAAGALSGIDECTVSEARERVAAWLNQEVS